MGLKGGKVVRKTHENGEIKPNERLGEDAQKERGGERLYAWCGCGITAIEQLKS